MHKIDSKECAVCPLAAILRQAIDLNKMVLQSNIKKLQVEPSKRLRAKTPYLHFLN